MAGVVAKQVGARVADRRKFLDLSQDEVVARMAPRSRDGKIQSYGRVWLSGIENGKHELSLDQLYELAEILESTPEWLLVGDPSGDSEFIANMRKLEKGLDHRGRYIVQRLAAEEAAQASTRVTPPMTEFERVRESLLAAGVPRSVIAQAEPEARRILQASIAEHEQEAEQQARAAGPRRGAAR